VAYRRSILQGKDFLSISALTPEGIRALISAAVAMKARGWSSLLSEKVLVLMFEKPSLRTRVSFEVAMRQLGGQCLNLTSDEVKLGNRESFPDAARVLSRYANAIAARTFSHKTIETLADNASIPIINALSDREHPCQALADLLTIYEKKEGFEGLTLAYIGDGNNVANSLILAAALCGINFRMASPDGYRVQEDIMQTAKDYAAESGSEIFCTDDPRQAVVGADIVYTDVWISMGQEAEAEQRRQVFAAYRIDSTLLSLARPDAILMHPLPAHHGEEVAEGILYCPQSVVFDQAENRLHAQKALLADILGGLEIGLADYE
jgi:ornithine carbamoyltransferase